MDRSASTNDRVHHVDAAGAIRELLVHMIRASTDGDLALVEALYERYKAIDPLQHNTLEGEEFQSKVESAMDYAAARGHAGILSYFLSQGLPISKGLPNMALLATRYSDKKAIEVFQVLLEHGWDINHCVGSTASPVLSTAVFHPVLLQWLLDHGADPNYAGSCGPTALEDAALASTLEVVGLLVIHGADIPNSNALHMAAGSRTGHEDRVKMMEYLLDMGADVNRLSDWSEGMKQYHRTGKTALHLALIYHNREKILLLLSRGADKHLKDSRGISPLDWATEVGGEVLELLKEY